jgi:heat shock protein HtpX
LGKRIPLFLLSNLAAALTVCVVVTILGAVAFAKTPADLPLGWVALGSFVWGVSGAWLSLLLSRWFAKKILGVRLLDGKSSESDSDWIFECVQRLAQQARLPMPEVGTYESSEVNAFSTGATRQRGLVAVSTGLVRNMSRQELTAVLAHEMTHIANGDMVSMTLLQGVVNAFVLSFARVAMSVVRRRTTGAIVSAVALVIRVVLSVVLGMLASMIAAAFSRRREFRADAGGAELVGREHMLGALRQLARTRERIDGSQPALACFKVVGGASWLDALATHPPLEQRIAALQPLEPETSPLGAI